MIKLDIKNIKRQIEKFIVYLTTPASDKFTILNIKRTEVKFLVFVLKTKYWINLLETDYIKLTSTVSRASETIKNRAYEKLISSYFLIKILVKKFYAFKYRAKLAPSVIELIKTNGTRKIAKKCKITRDLVCNILNEANIDVSKRKAFPTDYLLTEKYCKKCKTSKSVTEFSKVKTDSASGYRYRYICKICEAKRAKDYIINNFDKVSKKSKEYRSNNNEKIREYDKKYQKDRKKNDPAFKLRKNLSSVISGFLKKNNSKKNSSITKYLNYSFEDLKRHLEAQFEPWMNWNNHGKYNLKTWKDDDQSTWTWQLDHIIPQSNLPYSSMEDENFKKCWALSNLRPLSAKQNVLDGVSRKRH